MSYAETRISAQPPVHPTACNAGNSPGIAQSDDLSLKNEQKSQPWTPAHHAKVNKTKPVRLLELGEGPHGKNARFEFPEGWQRTIDLPTEADAWHPLFGNLPAEDLSALKRHTTKPITTRPDGKRIKPERLSFVTTTIGPRGGYAAMNHFDVPAEDFCAGQVTGLKCAAELLKELQRGYGPHISVPDIIHDAAKANAGNSRGKPSQSGAWWAFADVLEDALKFFAKYASHSEFLAHKIAEAEMRSAQYDEFEAAQRAQFVERMRKARATKRTHREQEGA